jgi:thiol:disulfide interchange protein DsbD
MLKIFILFSLLFTNLLAFERNSEILSVDKAFKPSVSAKKGVIHTDIKLAKGIYVYDKKLKYTIIEPKKIELNKYIKLPKPTKHDDFIVHMKDIKVDIPLQLIQKKIGKKPFKLQLEYQGCSTKGLCYPPKKPIYTFNSKGELLEDTKSEKKSDEAIWGIKKEDKPKNQNNESKNSWVDNSANKIVPKENSALDQAKMQKSIQKSTNESKIQKKDENSNLDQNKILDILKHSSFFVVLGMFFLLGLGLAFTPCIFPMIPILSSIITLESKQSKNMSAKRGFFLSLIYIISSALIYAIAGVLSALFGANILSAMQNPWVIVIFSLIFVALAFSMFGYYEIQLPKALQNFANKKSDQSKGGGLFGVAIMGALSALIVGPCVAPPLAAALIFIGQTGDIILGGLSLFLLGLGMGAPLLLIGLGGGKFMPKPGGWMTKVSYVFGVVMLGIAISFLSRILPPFATMLLWSLLFIASGIYAGALEPFREGASGIAKFVKVIAVILLAYGLMLLFGAFTKGESLLDPLKGLRVQKSINSSNLQNELSFKVVKNKQELASEIAHAKKPVLIDFSAKWCAACKELDEETFSDSEVKSLMSKFKLIRVDVTQNSDDDKALQKQFGIVGPPAIIFYDRDKKELKESQVVGFKPAEQFIKILKNVLGR